jgi:hypothetical protein
MVYFVFSFCNSYLGKKNPDACQHIIPSINKDMHTQVIVEAAIGGELNVGPCHF